MSSAKSGASDAAYYARSSYQQGGNGAAAGAQSATEDDQAYAQRLQQEEFRNAHQVVRYSRIAASTVVIYTSGVEVVSCHDVLGI